MEFISPVALEYFYELSIRVGLRSLESLPVVTLSMLTFKREFNRWYKLWIRTRVETWNKIETSGMRGDNERITRSRVRVIKIAGLMQSGN